MAKANERNEWAQSVAPQVEAFGQGSITRWIDETGTTRDEPRGFVKYIGVPQGTRTPHWSVLVEVERFNSEDWEGPFEVLVGVKHPRETTPEWLLSFLVSRGLEEALHDLFETRQRSIVGVRLAQPTRERGTA